MLIVIFANFLCRKTKSTITQFSNQRLIFHEWLLNIVSAFKVLKKFVLANQLFKSAIYIVANTMEAHKVESKADFIHRIKITINEADETKYWLILCDYS